LPARFSIETIDTFLDRITLHVDADVRVIDKPYGLAVQKGTRTVEDLDSLLMETSGCLVLAASKEAARLLGREIMQRRFTKTYWALVHGVPEPRTGTIHLPLIKAPGPMGDRVRAARSDELETAWSAVTHYEVLQARLDRYAFVALTPETGRQHQLRAHLAAIGHPIVGDSKYPLDTTKFTVEPDTPGAMLQLLAHRLTLRHPKGHMLSVAAPLPPHMRAMLDKLGLASRSESGMA
jgi:23S rRNA pseudouridine955/2504/2580 synthase